MVFHRSYGTPFMHSDFVKRFLRIALFIVFSQTGFSQSVFAQPSGWIQQTPPERSFPSMAYDEARQRTVLFGGWNPHIGDPGLDDTWEWDGERWTKCEATGPSKSWGNGMAYDSNRGVVVLHGGTERLQDGKPGDFVDTWEWDGDSWRRMSSSGPSLHNMVYSKGQKAVVGLDADGRTFSWDGESWTVLDESGPRNKNQYAMAYDEANDRIVLFGGNDSWLSGDTWIWDGESWSEVDAQGPPPNIQHSMTFDSIRNRVVMFGGYTYYDKTWLWDGQSWSSVTGTTPPQGRYSSMVFDKARGKTVLFGGELPALSQFTPEDSDYGTWTFDGQQWKLASAIPLYSVGCDIVYDRANKNSLLFGGESGDSLVAHNQRGKTYTWDGIRWTVHDPAVRPSPRTEHKMAFDEDSRGVWLFGGYSLDYTSEERHLNDLWFWDGSKWTLRTQDGPPERCGHAMAYDPERKVLVVFGGYVGGHGIVKKRTRTMQDDPYNPFLNDTWEWDGASWKLAASGGPSARRFSKLVYDPYSKKMLLFGGDQTYDYAIGPGVEHQDVWAWDGQVWEEIETLNPPLMRGSNVFEWPERQSILLLGDSQDSAHPAWEFKNGAWTPYRAPQPFRFVQNAISFDVDRNQFVQYAVQTWQMDAGELSAADSLADGWEKYSF